MEDLFKALQMFGQGVKEFQLQSAIGDANNHVQQIKAADMSEQQKRSELQNLSNSLVGHLAGIGANSQQIAAVAQSVGPKQFASADQASLEGYLTGNNDLVKLSEQADEASTANQMKLFKAKTDYEFEKQKRLFDHQLNLASLKQGGGQKLSDIELTKIQTLDETQIAGKNLLQAVVQNPGFVGPIDARIPFREMADADFAAFKSQVGQFFDKYRVAVTGAGASPGELKMLERNVPSITDPKDVFLRKMGKTLQLGAQIKKNYLSNLGKAKRDISGFTSGDASPSMGEAATNGAAAAAGFDPSAFIKFR